MVVVADRGLLSLDNLAELQAIKLPSGAPLEFILALPGRRYADVADLVQTMHDEQFAHATEEVLAETQWQELRLVVAHDPQTAKQQTNARSQRFAELEQQAAAWVSKLDAQEVGEAARGRKLSDGGACARFYRAVSEAQLARIIKVDLGSEQFAYHIDEAALRRAELMDGKLLLVSNNRDLTPTELIQRYKSLADIERGFRVLKSEIEIGPVFHRLPTRIRAHAAICFMALILHRVLRQRLKASGSALSPDRALDLMRRVQHHRINIEGNKPVAGISEMNQDQAAILDALKLTKPRLPEQLALL